MTAAKVSISGNRNIESIKPCPFCGSKDVFVMNPRLNNPSSILSNPRMEVICSNCGISMSPGFYGAQCDSLTDEQVDEIRHICVNAWNRRANDGEGNC